MYISMLGKRSVLLCNTAIDDFMCSQRPRLMETMSVSCKANNKRKQSKDPQALMSEDVACQRHFTDSDYRTIKPFGE